MLECKCDEMVYVVLNGIVQAEDCIGVRFSKQDVTRLQIFQMNLPGCCILERKLEPSCDVTRQEVGRR